MRFVLFLVSVAILTAPASAQLKRLSYNNPGLVVDLGVGLWAQPLPMDYDNDGDMDLLVATADVPSNGVYFFENPGGDIDDPIFKPGVRISDAKHNLTISYTDVGPVVMLENNRLPDFRASGLEQPVPLECAVPKPGCGRSNGNWWTTKGTVIWMCSSESACGMTMVGMMRGMSAVSGPMVLSMAMSMWR